MQERRGFGERIRRRIGAAVVDGFFYNGSRLARFHPRAAPERHGVEVLRDIPYRDGGAVEHLLDVYRPARREAPLPALLYVHGGGFRILSKDTHWIMALPFAAKGFVVFNVNYRLAPRYPYPAALEDVCDAYRYVVAEGERWGADPSRVVVAGESAGANLVTALTLACCYERPEPFARRVYDLARTPTATIAKCGMLQVSDPGRFLRRRPDLGVFLSDRIAEVHDSYLGNAVHHPEGRCDLADPLCILEAGAAPPRPLPPFFASAGTRDPLLDDTRRLAAALERLGTRCTARFYDGEVHAFQALHFRPNARACWAETFRFLDETLAP